MVLKQEQITEFSEQGFVILDGLLDIDDTTAFEFALRRTIGSQIIKAKTKYKEFPDIPSGRETDLGITALEIADHEYIADISDFLDMSPELLRLASSPLVHRAALQLMNCEPDAPSYITNCGIVLALPFDRNHTYGWHKDTYYTLPESKYVQMWAPLVETSTEELGTLEVCPGSHLAATGEQHAVEGVENRHRYRVNPEAIEKYTKEKIKMTVGQVLFFDSGLAHRSGGNNSDRPRYSIVSVYHQVENLKIRPIFRSGRYKGKNMEDYFTETCGDFRSAGDENKHFSPL